MGLCKFMFNIFPYIIKSKCSLIIKLMQQGRFPGSNQAIGDYSYKIENFSGAKKMNNTKYGSVHSGIGCNI